MSRALSSGMLTAILAGVVRPFYAVRLDFAGGAVLANSTPYTLTIDAEQYLGVGKLGGIAPVQEDLEIAAAQMAMTLYGIPRDLVGLALSAHYQGRDCKIYVGALDEAHAIIASPVIIFRGRIDTMQIAIGDTATITVTVENRLSDWDRERVRNYTKEDQEAEFPGDKFFDYVPKMQDVTLKWGRT